MLTFVMRRHAGEIPRGATVSEGVGCTAIGRTPLSERAILGLWNHYRHHEPWTPALTLVPLRRSCGLDPKGPTRPHWEAHDTGIPNESRRPLAGGADPRHRKRSVSDQSPGNCQQGVHTRRRADRCSISWSVSRSPSDSVMWDTPVRSCQWYSASTRWCSPRARQTTPPTTR